MASLSRSYRPELQNEHLIGVVPGQEKMPMRLETGHEHLSVYYPISFWDGMPFWISSWRSAMITGKTS